MINGRLDTLRPFPRRMMNKKLPIWQAEATLRQQFSVAE
jgi:hypothetical protein